jgi:hypothetical protein
MAQSAKNCFANVSNSTATQLETLVHTPDGCSATLGGLTLTPKVT